VRNGDSWQVTAVHPGGALTVCDARSGGDQSACGQVLLDAHYVAEHVQLGYAITAHRAQGATVDTSHVIVSPGMTREALYVAMTRGRHANKTYVVTEQVDPELEDHLQPSREPSSAQKVLQDVLGTEGSERSATEQRQQQVLQTRVVSTAQREQHQRRTGKLPMPVASGGIGVER
jgi:hypothetical protein